MIRLDKMLADSGFGTRAEVKKMLKKGQVLVDGTPEKDPGRKITEGKERVTIGGRNLTYRKFYYYLFHKPAGCVTATEDGMHETVLDYFARLGRKDLFPVGRLDLDTEGLLIITNDGGFSHTVLSPNHHIPKTYYAQLDHPIPEAAVSLFSAGVDIGDEKLTQPADLHILSNEDGHYCAELTLTEGRFHQVKRMFETVGCRVTYLKRIRMGQLELGDLQKGQWRELTEEEVKSCYERI